jgi:hypothetical protein
VGDGELRADAADAVHEELDGLVPGERRRLDRGTVVVRLRPRRRLGERAARRGERRDGPDHLPLDVERLAARGEDDEPGDRAQETLDEAGHRVDDVLAVVEHQDEPPAGGGPQGLREGGGDGLAGSRGRAERRGHGGRHVRGRTDRRELHPPHRLDVGCGGDGAGRELSRQPRLPRAARAGERHQPRAGERGAQGVELAPTSHESGEGDRDVVARGRRAEHVRCGGSGDGHAGDGEPARMPDAG